MIRSIALRSTTRSLITGKALARQGSSVSVSPSLKTRMCSWQTVVARIGPCGMPSTMKPHVPQIPSRQSESNAIGSSPRAISPSLTTSSISRNDMSGETLSALYATSLPGLSGPAWRHTLRVIRIVVIALSVSSRQFPVASFQNDPSGNSQLALGTGNWQLATGYWPPSLVAPLARLDVFEVQRFPVQLGLHADALELPRRRIRKRVVIAQRLALGGLAFLAEMAAG